VPESEGCDFVPRTLWKSIRRRVGAFKAMRPA
jgi:hypothetical protein